MSKNAGVARGLRLEQNEPGSLSEIVEEASQALARLDAERLEALAYSSRALIGGVRDRETKTDPKLQMQRELVILARMLELTKANLRVLRRAYSGRVEYDPAVSTD